MKHEAFKDARSCCTKGCPTIQPMNLCYWCKDCKGIYKRYCANCVSPEPDSCPEQTPEDQKLALLDGHTNNQEHEKPVSTQTGFNSKVFADDASVEQKTLVDSPQADKTKPTSYWGDCGASFKWDSDASAFSFGDFFVHGILKINEILQDEFLTKNRDC